MGTSFANPHESRDLTHSLGRTKESKGFVAYTKYNCDSYKSELCL